MRLRTPRAGGRTPVPAPGADGAAAAAPIPGVRVLLDLRPVQDPGRAPVTARYLEALLDALAADPLEGESFTLVVAADRSDPSARWPGLPVAGIRPIPPTRLLRAGALTVDPFLLRSASVGAGLGARDRAGAVYHAASGALPIASGIPVVAALLDLAPWALAGTYQRGPAARFGQRLRARLLRDAAIVLVPGRATALEARQLLHLRRDRIRVVPLAPRPGIEPGSAAGARDERERLGLPARYGAYEARFDARHDLHALLEALARLAEEPAPAALPQADWPPRICLLGASPDDRAAVARAAAREGVDGLLAYAPALAPARAAALLAGARAALVPARADAAGLAALDALAAGVPVIAGAVGVLPELVAGAGILVEPGDPGRLATALRAAWCDDALHASLASAAAAHEAGRRTWAEVARATRRAWAEAAAGS